MSGDGVVIVGGGLAGQRCAETLRARGCDARIRMICAEAEVPYDRPPLSKDLLAGDAEADSVAFRPHEWYAENDVELVLGANAKCLDPKERRLELDDGSDDGSTVTYETLVIATGARARSLPFLERFSNVHSLRTLADARRLREELRPGTRLVVVGAGFIGQEVAATARKLGVDVTIVEALPVPLAHILGDEVGRWFADLHAGEGVGLELSAKISGALGNGSVEALELEDGRRVEADAVVVGVGVAPAAEWLAGSGLEPDGVLTDTAGRTCLPNVYAAGDVTRPYDPRFGVHARTEHWDAAARQGAAAAKAMLGMAPGHPPLPSFWSDQYGLRVQYVGHAEHADAVRLEGDPEAGGFTAVYEREGRPVAALCVAMPRALARLRREIEASHANGNGNQPQESQA